MAKDKESTRQDRWSALVMVADCIHVPCILRRSILADLLLDVPHVALVCPLVSGGSKSSLKLKELTK